MKLYYLLLLCAPGLFLGGCKSSTSPASDTTTLGELFPLAIGDYWIYHDDENNSDGTVNSDYRDTLIVQSSEQYKTFQGFVTMYGGKEHVLYYNTGSDIYTVGYPTLNQSPYFTLHYPMNVGEVLVLTDTTYANGSHYRNEYIFRGKESVTVEAGQFNCYHFTNIGISSIPSILADSSFDDTYYAPGVGFIKETSGFTPDKKGIFHTTSVLVSYGKK